MQDTTRTEKVREAQRIFKERPTISMSELGRMIGASPQTVQRFLLEDPDNPPETGFGTRNPNRAAMAQQAIKMRNAGKSRKEVAEALGVSTATVSAYTADPTGKRGALVSKNWARKKKGLSPVTSKAEAEVEMNRMDLPITDKIRMRPVWQRRQRRIYMQNPLPPISDEEIADAIKIIGDKRLQKYAPALYFDAFLILDEAGK